MVSVLVRILLVDSCGEAISKSLKYSTKRLKDGRKWGTAARTWRLCTGWHVCRASACHKVRPHHQNTLLSPAVRATAGAVPIPDGGYPRDVEPSRRSTTRSERHMHDRIAPRPRDVFQSSTVQIAASPASRQRTPSLAVATSVAMTDRPCTIASSMPVVEPYIMPVPLQSLKLARPVGGLAMT